MLDSSAPLDEIISNIPSLFQSVLENLSASPVKITEVNVGKLYPDELSP